MLNQAREAFRGETAEVVRFGDSNIVDVTVWRFDGTEVVALDRERSQDAGEAARALITGPDAVLVRDDDEAGRRYLSLLGADEAVLAPLRYDGQTVGALSVHDRLGEVRGFSTSDVQLLQTIANHASVALHNEMLIGRLRHDALHGHPDRAAEPGAADERGHRRPGRVAQHQQRRHQQRRGAHDHRPQRLQGRERHARPPRR